MEILKLKTLFILDWDDTLFPTTWIINNNINILIPLFQQEYIIKFNLLDKVLSNLINNLLNLGTVIIITNALLYWIRVSSIIIPRTHKILQNIQIISAKGSYKNISSNMMDWKIMAFNNVIDKQFNKYNNIISIGDAEYEYNALISLNNKNTQFKKYLKAIRFVKDPSQEILIDQLQVINNAIPSVCEIKKHLDLKFSQINT